MRALLPELTAYLIQVSALEEEDKRRKVICYNSRDLARALSQSLGQNKLSYSSLNGQAGENSKSDLYLVDFA